MYVNVCFLGLENILRSQCEKNQDEINTGHLFFVTCRRHIFFQVAFKLFFVFNTFLSWPHPDIGFMSRNLDKCTRTF
jgi:hypothetical protein